MRIISPFGLPCQRQMGVSSPPSAKQICPESAKKPPLNTTRAGAAVSTARPPLLHIQFPASYNGTRRSEPKSNSDNGGDEDKYDWVQFLRIRHNIGKDKHQSGQCHRLEPEQAEKVSAGGKRGSVKQRDLDDRIAGRSDQRRRRGADAIEGRVHTAVAAERLQHTRDDDDAAEIRCARSRIMTKDGKTIPAVEKMPPSTPRFL